MPCEMSKVLKKLGNFFKFPIRTDCRALSFSILAIRGLFKKKKTCYFLKAEYTTCFCLLSSSIIYGTRLHLKLPSCTLFLVLLPLWTKASIHIANQLQLLLMERSASIITKQHYNNHSDFQIKLSLLTWKMRKVYFELSFWNVSFDSVVSSVFFLKCIRCFVHEEEGQ